MEAPERIRIHSSVLFQVDDDGEDFVAEYVTTEEDEGVGFDTEYIRADLATAALKAREAAAKLDPNIRVKQIFGEEQLTADMDKTEAGYVRHLESRIRELAAALKAREADVVNSCPCIYTEPCDERCTCVQPFSSRGCRRCCAYGSLEQRRDNAKRLAAAQQKGSG